jgi:hypothetical protein
MERGGVNLYAYVQNAPVKYRGPSGLLLFCPGRLPLWGTGPAWGNPLPIGGPAMQPDTPFIGPPTPPEYGPPAPTPPPSEPIDITPPDDNPHDPSKDSWQDPDGGIHFPDPFGDGYHYTDPDGYDFWTLKNGTVIITDPDGSHHYGGIQHPLLGIGLQ